MVFFRFVSVIRWYVTSVIFQCPEKWDIFLDCLKSPCETGTYTQKKLNSWFFLSEVWLFISVFPVMCWRTFSVFDLLDSCLFLLFGPKVLNGNVILDRDGVTNLSRPPFETTSGHPLLSTSNWLLDDNMDTLLPRGSKNTWASPQMHFFRWKSSFHRRFQIYVKRSPTRLRLQG